MAQNQHQLGGYFCLPNKEQREIDCKVREKAYKAWKDQSWLPAWIRPGYRHQQRLRRLTSERMREEMMPKARYRSLSGDDL